MNGMTRSRFRKLPILRPPSRPRPRWCRRRPGTRVSLEFDILAKHVEKLLRRLDLKQPLTVDKLREQGY